MSSLFVLSLASLGIARTWALGLLLLPLLLWLYARLRPRPQERFTGALGFWSDLRVQVPQGQKPRAAPLRPVVYLVLAALLAGSLAALGFMRPFEAEALRWRVILDCSPSMYLGRDDPGSQGLSRLERGVQAAHEMLGRQAGDSDRVEWVRASRASLWTAGQETPGEAWLEATASPEVAPDFAFHDRAGCLWVSDSIPTLLPEQAGWIAVGGESVPGPVGLEGAGTVVWDGLALQLDEAPRTPGRMAIVERSPEGLRLLRDSNPLSDLARLWARERGLELTSAATEAADLVLSFHAAQNLDKPLLAQEARWSLGGTGQPLSLAASPQGLGEAPWLWASSEAAQSQLLVAARPGLIRIAWSELEAPGGSPAAFALAWCRLFDRYLLAPPDLLPLAERLAPGSAGQAAPRQPISRAALGQEASTAPEPWSFSLAALGAALALVAVIWDRGIA